MIEGQLLLVEDGKALAELPFRHFATVRSFGYALDSEKDGLPVTKVQPNGLRRVFDRNRRRSRRALSMTGSAL